MCVLKVIPTGETIVERIYGNDGSDNPKHIVTTDASNMFYFYDIVENGFELRGRHKNAARLLVKYLK